MSSSTNRPRRKSSVGPLRGSFRSLDVYTRGVAADVAAHFKKLLGERQSVSQHADNRLSLAMETLEDRVLLSASVSIGDAQVIEGGDLQFAVTLSEAVSGETQITYSTADDSANVLDNDYTGQTAQTIVIPAGETEGIITVETTSDNTVEPNETLNVNLMTSVTYVPFTQLGQDIDGEAAGDYSGRSVALSGDGNTMVVGAYGNDDGGQDAGQVRIYDWNGTAWMQRGQAIDGEAANNELGWSVALNGDGNTLVVGAAYNDGNGSSAGQARVYDWNAGSSLWEQRGLDIDGEAANDLSGWSVALSGDGNTLVVGAPYKNNSAGQARIYDWTGTAWLQRGADIDGEANGDQSGWSVALSDDGNTVAVGAPHNQVGWAGHARVYDWNGTAWLQRGLDIDGEGFHNPRGGSWGDQLGYSVALSADGNSLVVGAPGPGVVPINVWPGQSRVYDWNGTAWLQRGLDIESEAYNDKSGWSVDISADGNTLTVGAPTNNQSAGHARVYDWNGTTSMWEQRGLDIDGEAANDSSGWSLALSGDGKTMVVGAPYNDGNGGNAGHTRVYRAPNFQLDNAQGVGTILNDDTTVSIGNAQVDEGGVLQFVVTLSEAVTADTLITYSTANGSATLVDNDYTSQTEQTLVIPANETEGIITIATTSDNTVEPDETLNVNLIAASTSTLTLSQLGLDIDGESANDWSGFSVAVSSDGNTLVAGAPFNDGNGNDSGHARVFDWNGTAWLQRGPDIDGVATYDYSSVAVSLSADGNTLVVGASDISAARVFDWNAGSSIWEQRGLDIVGEEGGDESGWSLALSDDGNTLVVGAPKNNGNGTDAGHARVYDWNGTAWEQRGLDIDGDASFDRSAWAVALSGDGHTLVVGANGVDDGGEDAGHARVYDWNGSAWLQRGQDIDGEAANDNSGYSVALSADGNTLVVGAPYNAGNSDYAGHARVYDWNGTDWLQRGEDINGLAELDFAGYSVSLSSDGNTLVVGAPQSESFDAGLARVYNWNAGTAQWEQLGQDIDGEASFDGFGHSVALGGDGTTVVVGAPFNDGNGEDAGQVRVYRTASAGSIPIIDSQAVGTILNDDTASIIIGDVTMNEGDSGATAFQFTVYLENAASKNITVDVALGAIGDTAIAGTDYIDFGTQTVIFWPGQTTKTVTVNVFGDEIVESTRDFTVSLVADSAQLSGDTDTTRAVIGTGDLIGNDSGDDSIATGFITNDDSAEFTINSVTGDEADGAMTFTVSLSNAVDVTTSVDVTLTDVTTVADDHGGTSTTTLTFAPGETSKTFTVTPVDDNLEETDKTFEISLNNVNDGGYTGDITASAVVGVGTILNDDATLSIAAGDNGTYEGTSTTPTEYTFIVTRSGDTSGVTTVDWEIPVGQVDDYVGGSLPSGSLIFLSGEISKNITVSVNADSTVEADDGFNVYLSNVGPNASTSFGTEVASGEFFNDDSAEFTIDSVAGRESDGAMTFTVTLSNAVDVATSVDVTLTDVTTVAGDHGGTSTTTLTFAPGETSQTFTVTPVDDNLQETDGTFEISLDNVDDGGYTGDITASAVVGVGTILNDDATVSITADESNGTYEGTSATPTEYTFIVTRSGDTSGVTTVDWEIPVGQVDDFVGGSLPSGSLIFLAGETSKTITISISADSTVEADDGFNVYLSNVGPNVSTSFGTEVASGEFFNDDSAEFTIDSVTGAEADGAMTFTVTLSNAVDVTTSVDVTLTDVTTVAGDHGGTSTTTLTFAPGETSQTFTVTPVDDNLEETDKTFEIGLGGVVDGGRDVTASAVVGVGTILNDDATLSIAAGENGTYEGTSGTPTEYTFIVTRSGDTSGVTTVDWEIPVGQVDDYVGGSLPSGSLIFLPGETSKNITVSVNADSTVETDDGFNVHLSNASPNAGTSFGTEVASGEFFNDDVAEFTIDNVTGAEADGAMTFTVSLSNAVDVTTSVDVTLTDVTTVADDHGGTSTTTLTFAPGETSQTFTVTPVDDNLEETDKTFEVSLDNVNDGGYTGDITASAIVGIGTILNDDTTLSIAADGLNPTVEGTSAAATAYQFIVTRTGDTSGFTTVEWEVSSINTDAADFRGGVIPQGSLTFAAGVTSRTINVHVTADDIVEVDEQFTVNLFGAVVGESTSISTDFATATVANDPTDNVIQGSSTNDVFVFRVSPRNYEISSNGNRFLLNRTLVDEIFFQGLGGEDTITINGGSEDETAVLRVGSVVMKSPSYKVRASSVEDIKVNAGGGANDRALMRDSAGNDVFVGRETFGRMTGDGFRYIARGFDRVVATASDDAGGTGDRALLFDSAGNDTFIGRETGSQMRGDGFQNIAKGFDQVIATASGDAGGVGDRALLFDSIGNDIFVGREAYSQLRGAAFNNLAKGFDQVFAYATVDAGGVGDRAFLYDSTGNDTIYGDGDLAKLSGLNFSNSANGFDKVKAFALADESNDTVDVLNPNYIFNAIGDWES